MIRMIIQTGLGSTCYGSGILGRLKAAVIIHLQLVLRPCLSQWSAGQSEEAVSEVSVVFLI